MLKDDITRIIKLGVKDQNELVSKLSDLGHIITQSSISRKLKQFGIRKVNGKYQIIEVKNSAVVNIEFTEPNLFVIRTKAGYAGSVASAIDKELVDNPLYPQFLGTIAGDDTIFIAVDLSERGYAWAYNKLKELL